MEKSIFEILTENAINERLGDVRCMMLSIRGHSGSLISCWMNLKLLVFLKSSVWRWIV